MGRHLQANWRAIGLFLLAAFLIVQCFAPARPALAQSAVAPAAPSKTRPPAPPVVGRGTEALPDPVKEMREAILAAARSGRIEELRVAYEFNELKPDLGVVPVPDPVAHWRAISGDGEGREVLAALAEILEMGYAVLPLGADLENNRIYVWPYLAEVALDRLTPAQEVDLLRLVPPPAARQMRAAGRYTHWRIAIGADGTWHSLRTGP